MSRRLFIWSFVVLFVTVPFASRFVAQAPTPVIYSAIPDGSNPWLLIRGANLPAGASVSLGDQLVGVLEEGTGDFIKVELPDGLMPGSYLLQVSTASSSNVGTFIVTFSPVIAGGGLDFGSNNTGAGANVYSSLNTGMDNT